MTAMSSDFEGMPLFAFEGMANRTPLMAAAVGGLPDLIENGRNGLLVTPRNPRELAVGIIALLADPKLRAQTTSAATEDVQQYAIEKIVGRFADLYEGLVATGAAGR